MQIACGVNGGIAAPTTVVVNRLIDGIQCATRDCESGLRIVWTTSYISSRRRDDRRQGTREHSRVIFTWSANQNMVPCAPQREFATTGQAPTQQVSHMSLTLTHHAISDYSAFPFRLFGYTIRGRNAATCGQHQRFSRPLGFGRDSVTDILRLY